MLTWLMLHYKQYLFDEACFTLYWKHMESTCCSIALHLYFLEVDSSFDKRQKQLSLKMDKRKKHFS